ncbi:MAG: hypothetical protein CL886_02170 [Dehalococcoidia bacterium]|nr:hypothetical protein [Dehalococcoidia bacterium]
MIGHPRWAIALRLAGLGWYVAFCIVGGIVAGIGLDKWLGSVFIFTLIGIILGTVTAFWGIYKMVQPMLYNSVKQSVREHRGKK